MSDLSPAAQAIASAYDDTPEKDTGNHRYLWLAAAFRAAAAIPSASAPVPFTYKLLAIADELEAQ